MGVTLALAGDTMLGRSVAERLESVPARSLVAPEVVALFQEADLRILNLECCISDRGSPWPAPGKPFFFRAPPRAVEVLQVLRVDCVTLANNHALDFGEEALLDTMEHLGRGGIAWVGAGTDVQAARRHAVLEARGQRVAVVGLTDHPADFAASLERPGVAYADLREGTANWATQAVRRAAGDGHAVLVSPHWGPNMTPSPVSHVRAASDAMMEAGASLIAGHSAHVFHGVKGGVLFDLGDFLDDYAVDPDLRNDLGLLWLVALEGSRPVRLEAVPLKLEFCHTRMADQADAVWIGRRFAAACAEFGTDVRTEGERLVVDLS